MLLENVMRRYHTIIDSGQFDALKCGVMVSMFDSCERARSGGDASRSRPTQPHTSRFSDIERGQATSMIHMLCDRAMLMSTPNTMRSLP